MQNFEANRTIGPLGDAPGEMLGCWASWCPQDAVSLAAGIRAKLPADSKLVIAAGCNITNDTAQISAAVSDAKSADAVILALGEPRNWSGESKSRTKLGVTGRQLELFRAVVATGKPVIVVLFNGWPLTSPKLQRMPPPFSKPGIPVSRPATASRTFFSGTRTPRAALLSRFPYEVGQVPLHYPAITTTPVAQALANTKAIIWTHPSLHFFHSGLA